MLGFFSKRLIQTVECVGHRLRPTQSGPHALRIESGGQTHTGWLLAEFDAARSQVLLRVSDSACVPCCRW